MILEQMVELRSSEVLVMMLKQSLGMFAGVYTRTFYTFSQAWWTTAEYTNFTYLWGGELTD